MYGKLASAGFFLFERRDRMGVKEYSIAFAIAGKLSGAFNNSFKKAGSTVDNPNFSAVLRKE